jgi:hypothetical protein
MPVLLVLALVLVVLVPLLVLAWRLLGTDDPTRRAEALLKAHLTPTELAQLNSASVLHVPSGTFAGRVYVIPTTGAVTVLQDGREVMRVCVRPAKWLPGREAVLAHKIYIQAAEAEYLSRGNVVWRASHLG